MPFIGKYVEPEVGMRKTVGFFDMLTVACLIAPAPFFWMPPLWITALMMPRHGGADTGTAAGTRNCLLARGRDVLWQPTLSWMPWKRAMSQANLEWLRTRASETVGGLIILVVKAGSPSAASPLVLGSNQHAGGSAD